MDIVYNQDKNYLKNPKAKVKIIGDTELEIVDLHMSFSVDKDLDEEPNEAEINIYNLNENTRNELFWLANKSAPIELHVTPSFVDEYVIAFIGEIDSVKNVSLRPGHETRLFCTSQKDQHRNVYIDDRTYAAGTPKNVIIKDFLSTINIPAIYNAGDLPSDGILLSQSFSGPAFPLLKRFCFDIGMHCFINDGAIRLSSYYVPQNQTSYTILKKHMLSPPQETDRKDSQSIEMQTFIESINKNNPFWQRKRKRRKTKKTQGTTSWVEYESVDVEIPGMDFEVHLQPDRQPDDLLVFPDYPGIEDQLFRVISLQHYGDNFGGDWTTSFRTDFHSPAGEDILPWATG